MEIRSLCHRQLDAHRNVDPLCTQFLKAGRFIEPESSYYDEVSQEPILTLITHHYGTKINHWC